MSILKYPLKKVLPQSGIESLKRLRDNASIAWVKALVRFAFLRRVHYAFFSDAFDHEAQAVVEGQLRHVRNRSGVESSNFFLRRAVHRIEKGLIMQPRRDVFALDYIEQTVEAYSRSLGGSVDSYEICWAHDVLAAYFEMSATHPVINRARERFLAFKSPHDIADDLRHEGESRVPFAAGDAVAPVSYASFTQLCMKRRSVRWYDGRAVPRQIIDQAVELAVQSPSACNRQPFRFIVFDDPQDIAQVSELPMGVAGFNHNFPAMVAIVGRMRAYPHARDRHVIYIDGALAAMSFIYALETLGVSSCSINWPDIPERERAATKLLGLEPDERIVMFISLGYAAHESLVPYSQKISLEEARVYGNFAVSSL
ncbi:MAG: nitroreductase family protein [Pseudomonas sp.]|uniref:nitroreductase family protein n=1 Tax=Halopseudomonas laoshanensis TaxID=2268758 RepID=UPI001B5EAD8F|nr:nitroreductase family protein [Pseudomonas sp.]MBQ0778490.1 nitroreductase family protein [Pseudomonas sp.]